MQEPLLQRHNLQTGCGCPVCSRRVLPRLPSQYEPTPSLTVFPHGGTLSESAIWMLFPTWPTAFHLSLPLSLSALQLKATGSICRPKSGDCDLEEYCTGSSASCPTDAFTMNGLACNRGTGYCYNGQCPSHQQHCRRLWGPGKIPAMSCLLQRDTKVTLPEAAVWFVSLFRGKNGCWGMLPPTRNLQEDVVQPKMFTQVLQETTK